MHETFDPALATADDNLAEQDLNVTEDDLLEAKELAATFTLEGTRTVWDSIRSAKSLVFPD